MRRWTFHISCGLSLMGFLVGVCLWARSHVATESVVYTRVQSDRIDQRGFAPWRWYGFSWGGGVLSVDRAWGDLKGAYSRQLGWRYMRFTGAPSIYIPASGTDRVNVRFVGAQFLYRVEVEDNGWRSNIRLAIPLWVSLLFAWPPYLWWRRFRRERINGFPVGASVPAFAK